MDPVTLGMAKAAIKDFRGSSLRSFDPRRDLPTLIGWYDSTTLRGADASLVTKFRDLSGAGNDLLPFSEATQPKMKLSGLNSKPTLDCSNSGYLLATSQGNGGVLQPSTTGYTQPITYIALAKVPSGNSAATRNIVSCESSSQVNLGVAANSDVVQIYAGSGGATGGRQVADGQWHVLVGAFDTGTGNVFVDGYMAAATIGQTHGANAMRRLAVGATASGANPFLGEIAELLVLGTRPTLNHVQLATDYLSKKWGLGLTVPKQDGVSYRNTTDANGTNLRIWFPPHEPADELPLVIWSHQAGGNEAILPGYPLYPVVHDLVNAGFAVVATEQHGNSWGNASAVSDITAALAKVDTLANIGKVILLGVSMGGIPTALAAKYSAVPAGRLKGRITIDAVASLRSMYSQGTYTTPIDTAYGITRGTLSAASAVSDTSVSSSVSFPSGTQLLIGNGTANAEIVTTTGAPTGAGPYTLPITAATLTHASGVQISDYPALTAGRDPILLPTSDLTSTPWRLYASASDTSVIKSTNADAMLAKLQAGSPPPSEVGLLAHKAGHVNGASAPTYDLVAFAKRCIS